MAKRGKREGDQLDQPATPQVGLVVPIGAAAPRRASPTAAHIAATDDILASITDDMNETFGDGVAKRLSSADTLSKVDTWVSTRSMVVDKVLLGGRPAGSSLVPYGRQMEISGWPGSGKTTLCAHIAAEAQATGALVVVTDTEERIDHPYWASLGVDTGRIMNLTANTLEEVFERQYRFIERCALKHPTTRVVMLWDSLGGTSTDSILDDHDAKGHVKKDTSIMERAKKAMMVKAKLISAGMEIINPVVARSHVAYIYTNTLYMRPDVDYGDPYETPGGKKKDFFASVRLRLRVCGEISELNNAGSKSVVGQEIEVKAIKNSMAPMRKTIVGAIVGGVGYSDAYTVWKIAAELKLLSKAGGGWTAWTTPLGEEIKFQGWRGFADKVVKHAEYPALLNHVLEQL